MLDTEVVVAAMRSPRGASAKLLRRIRTGTATMLLSVPLTLEYETTCLLAEHRLASGLSVSEVRVFVDRLISMSEPVQLYFRWLPQPSDTRDEMVLEAAVNGRAQSIVAFDEGNLAGFGIEVIRPGEVPVSMKAALEKITKPDDTSMNQFLAIAEAEKISTMETEDFFADRRKRADDEAFLRILNRQGGEEPRPEDRI